MPVNILSILVADAALRSGEASVVTFKFSEQIVDFIPAAATAGSGSISNYTQIDPVTWTAIFTPTNGVEALNNVITVDASKLAAFVGGGPGVGTLSSANYAVDTAAPTAMITVADNALAVGETTTVTIAFSEAVTDFDLSDLSVANGTLSALSSLDRVTWTATLTPLAGVSDTTNLIILDTALVTDDAGNWGTGIAISNNYGLDPVAPTATIVLADTALTHGETTLVTIGFSEKVRGFDNSDLTVANGWLSAVSTVDDGRTWTATFRPNADVAANVNVISLAATGVTDVAGNAGVGVIESANFTIDTTTPPDPNVPTNGADVISLSSAGGMVSAEAGSDKVTGGAGADTILGNTGEDTLFGGGGADIVRGGQGQDFVHGNAGDDLLFGDLGNDTVFGGQGRDVVQGGVGDDYVLGDLGDDTVLGGQGADTVFGGDGDDYLSGDLGDDVLNGGGGADLFNFAGGGGRDVVMDFSHAQGDRIGISASDAANFTMLSGKLASIGGDTVITLSGQTIVLAGVSAASLTAADFVFG